MPQERIGRYRVLEEIASGAQGTVYRAHDPESGRIVALKVLHRELSRDRQYVERFRREATLAASIDHPNIVRIFDVGEAGGLHFMAVEFLPESLARVIEAGALPVRAAAEYGAQVAEGLAAAHAAGVVHRDIKPQNVLIGNDGKAKVTDFGIARGESLTTMTATGVMMGTPHYMAPELVEGRRATEQSDIYALGCVLYQMLAGEVPFTGTTPMVVLNRHVNEQPEPIESRRKDVPRALAAVVERAMEKDPSVRFDSANEMAAATRAAVPSIAPMAEAPVERSAPEPPPPPRGRAPWWKGEARWWVGAATILALFLIVALLIGRPGGDEVPSSVAVDQPTTTPTPTPSSLPVATSPPTPTPIPSAGTTSPPTARPSPTPVSTPTAAPAPQPTATTLLTLRPSAIPASTSTVTLTPTPVPPPEASPEAGSWFTRGSSETSVSLAQGIPDRVDTLVSDQDNYRWIYGASYVEFSVSTRLVVGWDNTDGELSLLSIKPTGDFTIGSTFGQVLVGQGHPDRTDISFLATTWFYGSDSVEFGYHRDSDTAMAVIGWNNTGDALRLAPREPAGGFAIGSTYEEVLQAQGNPDRVDASLLDPKWFYGSAFVQFDLLSGTVKGWDDAGNLNLGLTATPAPSPTPVSAATLEVEVNGPPEHTQSRTPAWDIYLHEYGERVSAPVYLLIDFNADGHLDPDSEAVSPEVWSAGGTRAQIQYVPEASLPVSVPAMGAYLDHVVDWQVLAMGPDGEFLRSDADPDTPGDQPFGVHIDQTVPTITGVFTGHWWDSDAMERKQDRASNLEVVFDGPMGAWEIAASDFQVTIDGVTHVPVSAEVHPDVPSSIWLTLAARIPSDATPLFRIVDVISDMAGNSVNSGSKVATDSLAPVITLSLTGGSAADPSGLTRDDVTARITTDEPLSDIRVRVFKLGSVQVGTDQIPLNLGGGAYETIITGTFFPEGTLSIVVDATDGCAPTLVEFRDEPSIATSVCPNTTRVGNPDTTSPEAITYILDRTTPSHTPTPAPTPSPTPTATSTPEPTPSPSPPSASTFTIGSSKTAVLQSMGNPTRMSSSTWDYGDSSVKFGSSSASGVVTGWDNTGGNLQLEP